MSRSASAFDANAFAVQPLDHPCAPAWLAAHLEDAPVTLSIAVTEPGMADIELHCQSAASHTWVQARLPGAAHLDGDRLEQAAYHIYMQLSRCVADCEADQDRGAAHPWRFWNFVPGIVTALPDGRDRYMAFNAGRHRAFEQWHGNTFQPRLVAASAVDHLGSDLIVQMLAGPQRATAIENPRQRSAYRYSKRFGPVPPSFARATLAPQAGERHPHLYVAGTASIVGEESLHPGDVIAQTHETLRNLNALLDQVRQQDATLSTSYHHLRVYLVQPGDAEDVLAILHQSLPELERVELMNARLCRPELLVEIDGMARCRHAQTNRPRPNPTAHFNHQGPLR